MSSIVGIASVITDATGAHLRGVTDLEFVSFGSDDFLYIASEVGSVFTAYQVTDPANPLWRGANGYAADSGTITLTDIEIYSIGGVDYLVTLGRYDDEFGLYSLAADGRPTRLGTMRDATPLFTQGAVVETLVRGSNTFAFTAAFGRPGFESYRVEIDGTFTHLRSYTDNNFKTLGDVSAFAEADFFGKQFLFVGSALDEGIHSYVVSGSGGAVRLDRQVPYDPAGSGFSGITELEAVDMGARSFVIAGSATTNSLNVFRVSQWGRLEPVEEMWDTLDTRFQGVTALEVIQTPTRTIVVAGGADDGLTLLELTWNGKLVLLETLWDDFNITLDNVSSLAATGSGELWTLAVGSSSEDGVTLIDLDFSRSGGVAQGGAVPDTIVGSAGEDEIWGLGKSDVIDGGAGDDRLVDGRGRDVMTGGAGADTFVFIEDGRTDWIVDFELGTDRIDLSDFDMLYDISELSILPRLNGAVIFVDFDIIRVGNPAGGPFDTSLFQQDDFIFG